MATKPRGRPESRSAPTTPIKPSGATLSARTRRRKLFSWNIKTVIMMRQHQWHDRDHGGLRFLALFDSTADGDSVGWRKRLGQAVDVRGERVNDGLRRNAGDDIGLHRERRDAIPPPDHRRGLGIIKRRELTERNRAPVRQRNRQLAESGKRGSLFVGRADDHVDQIDIVANLRNRNSRDDRIEHVCKRVRAQAKQPCLVLVDLNAHLTGRFDPIEVHVLCAVARGHDLREFQGNLADLGEVWTANAILHRPSDRRAKLERIDTRHDGGESLRP